MELLLRVHHKNLVGLVGYCDEGDNLALIYEYMANGDLREHMSGKYNELLQKPYLFMVFFTYSYICSNVGNRGGSTLNWVTRLKIVVDSAQGSL